MNSFSSSTAEEEEEEEEEEENQTEKSRLVAQYQQMLTSFVLFLGHLTKLKPQQDEPGGCQTQQQHKQAYGVATAAAATTVSPLIAATITATTATATAASTPACITSNAAFHKANRVGKAAASAVSTTTCYGLLD